VSQKVILFAALVFMCGPLQAQISTTTELTSVVPAAPVFGQPVTLSATVVPASATGTVSFMDGVNLVGVAPLDFSGHAQLTTISFQSGRHALRAVYGPATGGVYSRSESSVLSYIVKPVSGSGFAFSSGAVSDLSPHSLVIRDFNGDGKADMAVGNYGGNDVGVLLGNGTGVFSQAATLYDVGASPTSIAAGDFNGDGKTDLVTTNNGSDNISVLLGTGTGSFLPPSSYNAGDSPAFVVVGDFNVDGKADLAVVNWVGFFGDITNVRILLGRGDGTFPTIVSYPLSDIIGARSMSIGDFDGDGNADLVVACKGPSPLATPGGRAVILKGNGDGTFLVNFFNPFGSPNSSPFSVTAADFNGDGKLDIATADQVDVVHVLLGSGNGALQHTQTYPAGDQPYWIDSGDFNDDGAIDLVVANYGNDNQSVFLGNGNGTFQAATNYPAGGAPAYVAVTDFNADGIADFAVADFNSTSATVWLGTAPPATSSTLTTSANPSQYGQPVTLTAQLTPSNVSGRVEFLDGSTVLAQVRHVSGRFRFFGAGDRAK